MLLVTTIFLRVPTVLFALPIDDVTELTGLEEQHPQDILVGQEAATGVQYGESYLLHPQPVVGYGGELGDVQNAGEICRQGDEGGPH